MKQLQKRTTRHEQWTGLKLHIAAFFCHHAQDQYRLRVKEHRELSTTATGASFNHISVTPPNGILWCHTTAFISVYFKLDDGKERTSSLY